jgi:hypothetical protein
VCSKVLAASFTPRDWLWLRESLGVKSAQERVEVASNAQSGAMLFRCRLISPIPAAPPHNHIEGLLRTSLGVKKAQKPLETGLNAHNQQKVLPAVVLIPAV